MPPSKAHYRGGDASNTTVARLSVIGAVERRLYGEVDPLWRRRLRAVSWASNLVVMVGGVLVLVGRIVSQPMLSQWVDRPSVRPMQPTTAVLFVVAGLAAVLALCQGNRRWTLVGLAAAGAVTAGGVAVVIANMADLIFPPWMVTSLEVEDIIGGEVAGRPAANIGSVLAVLGISIILLASGRSAFHRAGQAFALGAAMVAATVVVAFAYGDESLRGFPLGSGRMPISAALLAIVLVVGIVTARPGLGLMGPIVSPWPGGIVLRRLLPFVLAGPPVMIALLLAAITPETQTRWLALAAVVMSGLLLIALFATAEAVSRSELRKEMAADITKRATTAVGRDAGVVDHLLARLTHSHGTVDGLEVAVRYRPAEGWLGGDSVLTLPLGGSRLAAIVIDVVGHGAEPAIAATRLGDVIRHSLMMGAGPSSALAQSWWVLEDPKLMATVSLVEIDASTGAIRHACAGSPPMLHVSGRGVESYNPTGPILMADPALSWNEGLATLESGDVLVIYSDGLADPSEPESVPVATVEDLIAALGRCPYTDAEKIADWCVDETLGQANGDVRDDVSLIVMRRP